MDVETKFKAKLAAGVPGLNKLSAHLFSRRKLLDSAVDTLQNGRANTIIWPLHAP